MSGAADMADLVRDVRQLALCRTGHPADAGTALIQAAAEILAAQLPASVVALAITQSIEEAMSMLPPVEVRGHA